MRMYEPADARSREKKELDLLPNNIVRHAMYNARDRI